MSQYLYVGGSYFYLPGVHGVSGLEIVDVDGTNTFHFHVFSSGGQATISSDNKDDITKSRDQLVNFMQTQGEAPFLVQGTTQGVMIFASAVQVLPPLSFEAPPSTTVTLLVNFIGGMASADFPNEASAKQSRDKLAAKMQGFVR